MNKCIFCVRRCSKFQVQECQNASVESRIKAAKFSLKTSIRADEMDKLQTEFL